MVAVRIRVGVSASFSVGGAYFPNNSTIVAARRSAADFRAEGYRQRPPSREGQRTSGRGRTLHRRALPLPDASSFPGAPAIILPPSPEDRAKIVAGKRMKESRRSRSFVHPKNTVYSPRVSLPLRGMYTYLF